MSAAPPPPGANQGIVSRASPYAATYLASRHAIPDALLGNIAGAEALIDAALRG